MKRLERIVCVGTVLLAWPVLVFAADTPKTANTSKAVAVVNQDAAGSASSGTQTHAVRARKATNKTVANKRARLPKRAAATRATPVRPTPLTKESPATAASSQTVNR